MATNYATDKLTTAIKNHLLNVDAIPPTEEAAKLAGELAEVCLTELKRVGLRGETVEILFAPAALQAKARVIE